MAVIIAEPPNFPAFSFSLSPLPLSSRLTVFPSFVDKTEFFFFSIKEEGEIEINRGLIIKSGY